MQSLQKGTFSYEITLQIASDDVREKIGYDESYYSLLEYVRVSISRQWSAYLQIGSHRFGNCSHRYSMLSLFDGAYRQVDDTVAQIHHGNRTTIFPTKNKVVTKSSYRRQCTYLRLLVRFLAINARSTLLMDFCTFFSLSEPVPNPPGPNLRRKRASPRYSAINCGSE